MENFNYKNPVEIVFGKDRDAEIGSILAERNINKVLLIYGGGSIKSSGLYDRVIDSLSKSGILCVEFAGIKSNPRVSDADRAVALGIEKGVKAVLAVGGGSVIDTAKAVAAGIGMNKGVWDFYTGVSIEKAVPIFTIVTLAATASEMNSGFVLTNEKTGEKLGNGAPCLFPQVSILNPENTFTVPKDYTAYGAVDICAHVLEGYLTCTNNPWLINGFVESIIKTVIRAMDVIQEDPYDYKARSEMMWASSMALNGTCTNGVAGISFPNHMIEHGLSAVTDIPHGAGLSIILPAWARWYYKKNMSQFENLAKNVFLQDSALKGIEALEAWFVKIGAPVRLGEFDIKADLLSKVVEKAYVQGQRWGIFDQYTKEVIFEILESAL